MLTRFLKQFFPGYGIYCQVAFAEDILQDVPKWNDCSRINH